MGCSITIYKKNLDLNLIPYIKLNSKLSNLTVKCKTIKKILEKSRRKSLGSRARQRVLKLHQNTVSKGKTGKLDFTNKIFCPMKDSRGWKDKLQIRWKYLQTVYLTEDLYLENIKNPQNPASEVQGNGTVHPSLVGRQNPVAAMETVAWGISLEMPQIYFRASSFYCSTIEKLKPLSEPHLI